MEPSVILRELAVILAGYMLGCFATGYYLVRWRTGQDIRAMGSGATGGRNVGRVLGKPGFFLTGLGDTLKGSLALWAASYFELSPWAGAMTMAAVVMGHIWPIQLGFRGGRGLGPAFGAMLVLDFQLTLVMVTLAVFLSILVRRFTVGFMVVVAITPAIAAVMGHALTDVAGMAATALLILIAHRTNIRAVFERAPRATGEGKESR